MTAPADVYSGIHKVASLHNATEQDLRLLIQTFPVIDNHAHNLLREEHACGSQEYPFESITSEAQGHALHDHVHSNLAHIRGIDQLAELYRCPPTLDDVKAARYEWVQRDYPGLIKKCFEGTHAIMMDDGLSQDAVKPVDWHRQFAPTVSRIVRIEAIAADILEQLVHAAGFIRPGVDADWTKSQSEPVLMRFNTMFRNQIRTLAQDPNVRGFKSVVCYRSGLDVSLENRHVFRPHQSLTESLLLHSFHTFLQQAVRSHNYRIAQKEVNDYLVVATCDVLDKLAETDGENLPIQFHTGLGDIDIDLVKANPAYMKPLITAFPNVDFVLLHSSYPYTREAGYLAANFANVWLDIGEAFPMLSREGEESVLRQSLELTPTSKILWSTDGHFYPETYYLANKQFRSALEKTMIAYVQAGDITAVQAINMAADIMFWNSNQLYKLDEERRYPQLAKACGRSSGDSVRSLANGSVRRASQFSRDTTIVASRPSTTHTQRTSVRSTVEPSANAPTMDSRRESDVTIFDDFAEKNSTVKYIWLQFLDYTGTMRQRMIPVAAFRKHIVTGNYPENTSAMPGLIQNDLMADAVVPIGVMKMMPDLSSLCLNAVRSSPSATVQTWWMEDTPDTPDNHSQTCPRWALQKHVNALKSEFNIDMLMGVEIEVIFMRPVPTDDKSNFQDFLPLHMVHSWTNFTYQDLDILPMVEEIVEALASADIHLSQFHAEAAPGQWEFPLPACEPVKAIDVMYKARDIIRYAAYKHGLKATLYPRPFNFTCGSASHVHFSINGPGDTVNRHSDNFLAGILTNLSSIVAFSLPLEESYARVNAGIWAGGEYVCWGTQNREAPLRKCGPGHWELKTVDGVGNMYLTMAAVTASGLHGLRDSVNLTCKDNLSDASLLSAEQRQELGITTKLPKQLGESIQSLKMNKGLREMMSERLIDVYVSTKEVETKTLNAMDEHERKVWLISRY